jgi:hypothetical protein
VIGADVALGNQDAVVESSRALIVHAQTPQQHLIAANQLVGAITTRAKRNLSAAEQTECVQAARVGLSHVPADADLSSPGWQPLLGWILALRHVDATGDAADINQRPQRLLAFFDAMQAMLDAPSSWTQDSLSELRLSRRTVAQNYVTHLAAVSQGAQALAWAQALNPASGLAPDDLVMHLAQVPNVDAQTRAESRAWLLAHSSNPHVRIQVYYQRAMEEYLTIRGNSDADKNRATSVAADFASALQLLMNTELLAQGSETSLALSPRSVEIMKAQALYTRFTCFANVIRRTDAARVAAAEYVLHCPNDEHTASVREWLQRN